MFLLEIDAILEQIQLFLPNVDIVDDVIIGAGSVVTKSINMKPYVGVPANIK